MSFRTLLLVGAATTAYACAASNSGPGTWTSTGGGAGSSTSSTASGGGATADDGGTIVVADAQSEEPPLNADAACAATSEEAAVTVLPVDIIWMVDNSASMSPAIAQIQQGLNAFASTIEGSGLDYQVIMLSLRGATSPIMVGGSNRYPVCIPPPLSGNTSCGDGARFFQSSIDVHSTQPLEQLLGTLGQTAGYTASDTRGGPPWAGHLRPQASKTIVVVTDDNARLSATDFETFAGGKNPYNSTTLPPGILDPSWNGLFDRYLFSGIYGWGSANDPSVLCSYPDNTMPASSGSTYTTLVQKTGGVRAKICDGAAAWQPFFDAVAQAVIVAAKLSCDVPIPAPGMGTLDPSKVNVTIGDTSNPVSVPGVVDVAACAGSDGWYYDDPQQPTEVVLCPASCDQAQQLVGPGKPGHVNVLFGCQTILK